MERRYKTKGAITRFLKTRLGAIPYTPDPRDYQTALLTPAILEQIPDSESHLLDYVTTISGRSQGNIGSCVGWCNSFAYETALNIKDLTMMEHDHSAGWMYQKSRERADVPPHIEGSTNFGAMKALLKDGSCSETFCKTDTKYPFDFDPEPEATEYASCNRITAYYRVPTTPSAMKAALLGLTHDPGYKMPDGTIGLCPLVTAFPVYKNTWIDGYEDGYVRLPDIGDELLGGHSSLLLGWMQSEGKTWWINYGSWGTGQGGVYTAPNGEVVEGIFFIEEGYPFYDAWVFRLGELPPPPEPKESIWCTLGRIFLKIGGCDE
ncbi:hypothetical protein D4R42_04790 [bacterium]|nr:MAG: hypothetical protein D4R42_04790 [bacterium]